MLSVLAHTSRPLPLLAASLVLLTGVASVRAQTDDAWPRQIDTENAKVLIYQPQLESFEGNELAWRAAVSVTLGDAEPGHRSRVGDASCSAYQPVVACEI